MFNLIKTQWIGLVAIVFVAFGFFSSATVEGLGAIDATTYTNPQVFSDTVTFSSTITYLESTESITGANTVTKAESGKTFVWNTTGATSTLPSVATATGTVYRFVVGSALATTNAVILSAEGDNMEGSLIVAGAVVDCDANDRIELIVDGENLGDFVEVRSDGQKWFITTSNALTAGKLTCNG
jgi:hypothetical protein